MRDFEAIIPTSKIIEWCRLSTPEQEIGGILVLSIHEKGLDLTGIDVFPVFWKKQNGTYQMVVGNYEVKIGMNDSELLDNLRNPQTIPQSLRYLVSNFTVIESKIGQKHTSPLIPEFELVFLDINVCKLFAEKDDYFYYSDGNTSCTYYLKSDLKNSSKISRDNRGIILSRGIIELTSSNARETEFHRTLISRPYPVPEINQNSPYPASVAYMLHPTCPPVWKSETALKVSTPSAKSQEVKSQHPKPQIEQFSWKALFWVLLGAFITILIQMLSK
jgi:hypothetical protein